MMRLDWNREAYGVGVTDVDEQHQELFDRINTLLEAIEDGRGARDLHILVGWLGRYVVTHFVSEERHLLESGSPDRMAHVAEHRAFGARLANVKQRLAEEGPSDALAEDVRAWVVDWAVTHIRDFDRKLAIA